MALENDIEKWLLRELSKDRGDKPVKNIVIRHAAIGSKGNDVETMDLSERSTLTPDDLGGIAEEIISRCQVDADGQGGLHRYVVSLVQKGETKGCARFPFRIKASVEDFDEAAGDEPANMRGITTQLMRHNEAMAKTLVHAVSGITQSLTRRLESSDATVARLTEAAQKNMALLEDARSEQHGRDMELLSAEQKNKREDMMFEKLALLVPVVINRLAGQKVFNTEDPGVMMLKAFADSITVEQFGKLQSQLSPEQAIVLGQIFKAIPQKSLPPGGNPPNGTAS